MRGRDKPALLAGRPNHLLVAVLANRIAAAAVRRRTAPNGQLNSRSFAHLDISIMTKPKKAVPTPGKSTTGAFLKAARHAQRPPPRQSAQRVQPNCNGRQQRKPLGRRKTPPRPQKKLSKPRKRRCRPRFAKIARPRSNPAGADRGQRSDALKPVRGKPGRCALGATSRQPELGRFCLRSSVLARRARELFTISVDKSVHDRSQGGAFWVR